MYMSLPESTWSCWLGSNLGREYKIMATSWYGVTEAVISSYPLLEKANHDLQPPWGSLKGLQVNKAKSATLEFPFRFLFKFQPEAFMFDLYDQMETVYPTWLISSLASGYCLNIVWNWTGSRSLRVPINGRAAMLLVVASLRLQSWSNI